MKPEYQAWIDAYVTEHNQFVRGKCKDASTRMAAAFPGELRQAAGFVHVAWGRGREQHFWCVTTDGEIVDQTALQYAQTTIFEYEELDLEKDRHRIPTGCCMDCGDDVYGGATFCNDECERATREYMNQVAPGVWR